MKLLTNIQNQPLLQTNSGQVINLNTLEPYTDEYLPVKAGGTIKISKHRNNNFLDKAERIFSISKVSQAYGTRWYKLESNFILFAIVKGDTVQLIGNYPLHYLKLLYRYIISL